MCYCYVQKVNGYTYKCCKFTSLKKTFSVNLCILFLDKNLQDNKKENNNNNNNNSKNNHNESWVYYDGACIIWELATNGTTQWRLPTL